MRILVAGGTGAVGRQLVPQALAAGHEVVALSRRRQPVLDNWGIQHREVNVLDKPALDSAVAEIKPEAVIDLLTAIPRNVNPKHLARDFAATNRLRAEGTPNLIAAARAAGVRKYVAESIAFVYRPADGLANEGAAVWGDDAPKQFAPVLQAVYAKEKAVREFGGIVLRLGHLVGPGTAFTNGGAMIEAIKAHKLPVVGDGGATFSFIPVQDAAHAFLSALEIQGPAVFNVVDDEPARAGAWIPEIAERLGAKKPSKAPALVARAIIGGYGVMFMTKMRGASNAAAKARLAWAPQHSWRDAMLGEQTPATAGGAPEPALRK